LATAFSNFTTSSSDWFANPIDTMAVRFSPTAAGLMRTV